MNKDALTVFKNQFTKTTCLKRQHVFPVVVFVDRFDCIEKTSVGKNEICEMLILVCQCHFNCLIC